MGNFKQNIIVSLTVAMLLVGCGGGGGGSSSGGTTSTGGTGSKGPFKQGSTVIAYKLKSNGTRDTNVTTTTIDNKGTFNFSAMPWSGPTEFVIYGDYLNESTGSYMTLAPNKGISAIANITAGSSASVNINVLTNIAAKNIIAKMAAGTDINTAKSEAETSVKKLFNLDLGSGASLDDLDPTDASTNTKANTQLLLISSAILNTKNPEQVMQALADDMSDGSVDDKATVALDEVKRKIASVDLQQVAANMQQADIGVTNPPDNIESTLSGILAIDNNISFMPKFDVYRETPYISNEVTINGIYGGSGAISVSGGEYSINGATWTTMSGIVSNGQKVRIRVRSASTYSTKVTAILTIGGAQKPFSVTTQDDPFVADTSPANFDFGYIAEIRGGDTVSSSAVTIFGINAPTPISIRGGEYSINGAAWTTVSGTINNDDNVTVRGNASNIYGGLTTVSLTIGNKVGTFKIFTASEDTTPDPFSFSDATDQDLNATVSTPDITITGTSTNGSVIPVKIENGEYSLDSGSTWSSADTTIPDNTTIRVRGTAASTYSTTKEVKLTIGNVIGTFKIITKADPFVADTTPNALPTLVLVDQNLSDTITTPSFTISGINTQTDATIVGGSFDINRSGNFVTDANISNGDVIHIQQTTASTFNTAKTTTITIGGVTGILKTITIAKDTIPDTFGFETNASVNVGDTNVVSNTVTIIGINTDINISVSNGEYRINDGAWSTNPATISNGDTLTLRQPTVATEPETPKVTQLIVGSITTTFTTITRMNPPDINSTAVTSVYKNIYYDFMPKLLASSGSIQSWSIANKPSWAKFNTITGRLFGMPRASDVGSYNNITITGTNASGSDDISFNIEVKNHAPQANDINIGNIVKNSSFTGQLSATDDDNNETFVYKILDASNAHGDVNITDVVMGSYVYTPDNDYVGEGNFTYEVKDENNATSTGIVSLKVVERAITLIANDDTVTLSEDTNKTIDVMANDISKYDDGTNAPGTVVSVNDPHTQHGEVYVNSDNKIVYQPNSNYNGSDSINYTITSTTGTTATATVKVTVTPVNDNPVAHNDNVSTVDRQTSVLIDVLSNDTDIDGNNLSIKSVSNPLKGTVSIEGGKIRYTPTGRDAGLFSFTYTISDNYGGEATANVIVSVDANTSIAVARADNILSSIDIEQGSIDANLANARTILEAASNTDKSAKVALALLDFAEILNNSCINNIVDFDDSAIGVNYSKNLPKFIFSFLSTTDSVFDLKSSPSNFTTCTKSILDSAATGLKNASDKLAEVYVSDPNFVFIQGDTEISKSKADVMRATALLAASQLEYIAAHNFGIYSGNINEITKDIPNPYAQDQNITVTYRPIDVDPAYSWMSSYYYFAYDHSSNGVSYYYDTNGDGQPDGYLGTALSDSQAMLNNAKNYLIESASIARDINDTSDLANNIYNNLQSGSGVFDINDSNTSFTIDLNPLFVANSNANGAGNGIDAFDIAVNGKFTYDCNYDVYMSIINNNPTCTDGSPANVVPREVPRASDSDMDEVIKSVTIDGKTLTGDSMLMELFGDFDTVVYGYGWRENHKDARNEGNWFSQNGSTLTLRANYHNTDQAHGYSREELYTRIYDYPVTDVSMSFVPRIFNDQDSIAKIELKAELANYRGDHVGIETSMKASANSTNYVSTYVCLHEYASHDDFACYYRGFRINQNISTNNKYKFDISIEGNIVHFKAYDSNNQLMGENAFDFADINASVNGEYNSIIDPSDSKPDQNISVYNQAFNKIFLRARNDHGSAVNSNASPTVVDIVDIQTVKQ